MTFRIKKRSLMPYFTFGDPSISFTKDMILAAFDCGADMIEIGIPFLDSLADGAVIQRSHFRALNHQPHLLLDDAFDTVRTIKGHVNKPLMMMTSAHHIHHYSLSEFFKVSEQVGLDGVMIPDLPIHMAQRHIQLARQHSLALTFFVSPLCPMKRLAQVATQSSGFVYLMSSTGTTGVRTQMATNIQHLSMCVKSVRDIPVVVGFGVSNQQQLADIWRWADGVIIGSFLVNMIEKNLDNPTKAIASISQAIAQFKQA